jgi:hypothetical protein
MLGRGPVNPCLKQSRWQRFIDHSVLGAVRSVHQGPVLITNLGGRQIMNDIQAMDEERSVLRWGGMAGIMAGVLLVLSMLVFVMLLVLADADIEDPGGYPGVRAGRVVENTLYGAGLVLGVLHFLALYRALRRSSPAPALFGSALAILGLGLMAAGALLHIAHDPLSELYHAPGATPGTQETLVLVWQATMGILTALLVTGLVPVAIGLITLGVAMRSAPAFGRRAGLSIGLGVVGVLAALILLAGPTEVAVISLLALVVFHLVLGSRLISMSKAP